MTIPLDVETQKLRLFAKLTGYVVLLSLFVMVLGSYVRATQSGLSCPDWPLCFNQVIPVFDFQIFLEWFHRLAAGVLTVLVLGISLQLIKNSNLRKLFALQMIFAIALLMSQIILGGLTVLKLLDPKIVSLHLMNAVIFLTILLWIYAKAKALLKNPKAEVVFHLRAVLKMLFLGLCFLLFLEILVGGMVSSNYAGLVCPDFPTCHGKWLPIQSFLIWLQMSHRYLAFLVTAYIIFLYLFCSWNRLSPLVRRTTRIMPVLVIFQIGLGVINVYFLIPSWASALHLANALVMFSLSVNVVLEIVYFSGGYKWVQKQTELAKPTALREPQSNY